MLLGDWRTVAGGARRVAPAVDCGIPVKVAHAPTRRNTSRAECTLSRRDNICIKVSQGLLAYCYGQPPDTLGLST